jgi:hypothetical protein
MTHIDAHMIVLCLVMLKVMDMTAETVTSLGIDFLRRRRAALPPDPPAIQAETPPPSLP